jgi:hypothetical protein
MRSCTASLVALALVAGATAETVVEPDAFPAGTDISTAFPGVVLSTVNSVAGDTRVFATAPTRSYWASTGTLVFGHVGPYAEHWVVDTSEAFSYGALRATFNPPAASVTLDLVGNDSSDFGLVSAYDPSGALLTALETSELAAGAVETLTLSWPLGIGYVIAGGAGADTVSLDQLRFVPVPEPAALALLAVGGLIRVRRAPR